MPTKTPGRKPAVILMLAIVTLTLLVAGARASDRMPLHAGSAGPRVAAVQWLVSGHRPNVFTKIKPTLKHYTKGIYGARTKAAVKAYKYRAGWPLKGQCGAINRTLVTDTAGRLFFDILTGKAKRPACWISLAGSRVKAVEPGASVWALKAKTYGLRLLGLNIHEVPDGSNRGAAISYSAFGVPALQSATGAYVAAWCVSTWQTILKAIGYGTFANDTAGVYQAVDFYAAVNLVFAKPKVGSLVAFVDYDRFGHRIPGTGHMGFVIRVMAAGFVSLEGNASNRFLERFHPLGDRGSVFIRLPRLA